MQSLRELYKIGIGPSSSHTYGPMKIAERIKSLYPDMEKVHVDLYGSLSLTGKGHLTDKIMQKTFAPVPCDFSFKSGELPYHPNGMLVTVYCGGEALKPIEAYSIGGGEIYFKGDLEEEKVEIYPHHTMREVIDYCENEGLSLYDYVLRFEDENFKEYLFEVLEAMFTCVENGLHTQGILQGSLQLKRVAGSMYQQALNTHHEMAQERLFIASYAYAVSEENADGHMIVTAPTCGASGVLPAILYYAHHQMGLKKRDLVKALAIGGLYGNTVKGCQAEVGTACAMASASMAWINELNNSLVDYAAEMGLEHNLGLTCDPVGGYVQIPCIERNALAALRAYDAAMLAGQLGYVRKNKVPFDTVVRVMKETGKDLNVAYKETSLGGLAKELK